MVRLTTEVSRLLSASQLAANVPVPELAKKTRIKQHKIYYHLKRLLDQGTIRPWPFINTYLLGYRQFQVYFSLESHEQKEKDKLLARIRETKNVVWLAELGGAFQYGMSICAHDGDEVLKFLEDLASNLRGGFFKKAVSSVISFEQFQKKYISPADKSTTSLKIGYSPETITIDETDQKILSELYKIGTPNQQEIARRIGAPRSTIQYRLEQLEERGVIAGYTYLISGVKLGMQIYRFLVYMRGMRKGLSEEFYESCKEHPNIVTLVRCLGSWDYELGVEVSEPQQASSVLSQLHGQFGEYIHEIQLLSVFRQEASGLVPEVSNN